MVNYKETLKMPLKDRKKFLVDNLIFLLVVVLGFAVTAIVTLIPLANMLWFQYIPGLLTAVIVSFILTYFMKAGVMASRNHFTMLSLKDLTIYSDGGKMAFINLLYSIPLIIITAISFISIYGLEIYYQVMASQSMPFYMKMTESFRLAQESLAQTMIPKIHIFLPLIIAVSLLWWLIVSVADLKLIHTRDIKQAFNFKKIFKIAFSARFLSAFFISLIFIFIAYLIFLPAGLIIMVISLLLSSMVGNSANYLMLLIIPLVTIVTYYAVTVICTILGQAYIEADIADNKIDIGQDKTKK